MVWQPIQTAPKDEKPVWLGSTDDRGIAWWSRESRRWEWLYGRVTSPSHWQALPPLPPEGL